MSLTLIWPSAVLGLVVVIAFAILRSRYAYTTIRTGNFSLRVPRLWVHRSLYVVALLELCRRTARDTFALSQRSRVEVEIRPSWRPAFWYHPGSQRIVFCFVFGPAIDRWLFSVYFAIAHEYGHFVKKKRIRVESEAWANLFGLYTLRYVALDHHWPNWWERWLIYRDFMTGLATMYVWQFLPGPRREVADRFWRRWETFPVTKL